MVVLVLAVYIVVLVLIPRYNYLGLSLFLATPITKPFLIVSLGVPSGYYIDLLMVVPAVAGIILSRKKVLHAEFRVGRNRLLFVFYVMLFLAMISFPIADGIAMPVKKLLIFSIFVHLAVWLPVLYVRSWKNLKEVLTAIELLGVFCLVNIIFFPIRAVDDVYGRLSALGANPLAPGFFITILAISSLFKSLILRKRMFLFLIPFCLLAVVISGTRSPVIFFIVIVSVVVMGLRGATLSKAVLVTMLCGLATLLIYSPPMVMKEGLSRFSQLELSYKESRIQLVLIGLDHLKEHPGKILVGGGFGDSSYVYSGGDDGVFKYPHNWVLEVFMEFGVAGLLLMLYLFGGNIVFLIGIKRRVDELGVEIRYLAVVSAFIGFLVILNSNKTGSYGVSATAWFVLSLFYHVSSNCNVRRDRCG
ncbi:MAG: O-antigen ligase family protein [Deltaproteobacteria bacterium]|nr:O-antigen ligase family protein [Deltaproteobacteria bacterium]